MGISLDTRIQRVKVPKGRRMLAVSDIHGHGGFLKELLLMAGFSTYNSRLIQANPIIVPERKIISMDGGCGMREDGQLNLVIIPDIDAKAGEIHHLHYDELFQAEALDAQE